MVLSLRVVDATTGGTLSVGQSIGRYLGYYVSMIPLFIGLIWVAFDRQEAGLARQARGHGRHPIQGARH